MHITPEQECSYASFETSTPLTSYAALINNVLSTFRPMRVVVTLTGDAEGIAQVVENPIDNKTIHGQLGVKIPPSLRAITPNTLPHHASARLCRIQPVFCVIHQSRG